MHALTRGFSRQHRITLLHLKRLRITSQPHETRNCLCSGLHAYTMTTIAWRSYLPASPHRLTTTKSDPTLHTQTSTTTRRDVSLLKAGPTTPTTQPLTGITCNRFSLFRFRSPLLTESRLFSLPAGTEMFHFPAFPPHTLYIQVRVTPHHWCWVSPFGNPRITARLTAPRGLSQPPTSFIGS